MSLKTFEIALTSFAIDDIDNLKTILFTLKHPQQTSIILLKVYY